MNCCSAVERSVCEAAGPPLWWPGSAAARRSPQATSRGTSSTRRLDGDSREEPHVLQQDRIRARPHLVPETLLFAQPPRPTRTAPRPSDRPSRPGLHVNTPSETSGYFFEATTLAFFLSWHIWKCP